MVIKPEISLIFTKQKPEGKEAKDRSGWRGPCRVTDVDLIGDGKISVEWNGNPIISSMQSTRPHYDYPVLMLYGAASENPLAISLRQAALKANDSIHTFAWKPFGKDNWRCVGEPKLYETCLLFGIQELTLRGCIGGRVGFSITRLTPYPSADSSMLVAWSKTNSRCFEIDTNHVTDLRDLFGNLYPETCWV